MIESHSEAEILKGCVALMQELVGNFEEYLDYMGIKPDPDSNEEHFHVDFKYGHIVNRLFLWRTYHSGSTSTIEKCGELGIDSSDVVSFGDTRDMEDDTQNEP